MRDCGESERMYLATEEDQVDGGDGSSLPSSKARIVGSSFIANCQKRRSLPRSETLSFSPADGSAEREKRGREAHAGVIRSMVQ